MKNLRSLQFLFIIGTLWGGGVHGVCWCVFLSVSPLSYDHLY